MAMIDDHFATLVDPEEELKEIEEFKLKGKDVIHIEISSFVRIQGLNKFQIGKMIGKRGPYACEFFRRLRVSKNLEFLIYKWYLRYSKNLPIFHQVCNIETKRKSESMTKIDNHFESVIGPEEENKEIEEYKLKGEDAIRKEILVFLRVNNMTQKYIANMLGLSKSVFSYFLTGRNVSESIISTNLRRSSTKLI